MKKLLILLTILFSLITFSFLVTAVNIASCPADLNESHTEYVLTNNISFTGDNSMCINITAENVSLDCVNYPIDSDTGDNRIAIFVNNSNNVTIRNCNITGSISGIEVLDSDGIYILNNTLDNNNVYTGITTTNSNDARIENNSIIEPLQDGALITGSNNVIIGNVFDTAPYNGLLVVGNGNIITQNFLEASSGYTEGIKITGDFNNLTDNFIESYDDLIIIEGENNIITQGTLVSGSSDDVVCNSTSNIFINITYDVSKENGALTRKWHYGAFVNDSDGNVMANTNVSVFNSSNSLIFNLTTNAIGFTGVGDIIDYVNNGTVVFYYSNYNIFVNNGTLVESFSYNTTLHQENLTNTLTVTISEDQINLSIFTISIVNLIVGFLALIVLVVSLAGVYIYVKKNFNNIDNKDFIRYILTLLIAVFLYIALITYIVTEVL